MFTGQPIELGWLGVCCPRRDGFRRPLLLLILLTGWKIGGCHCRMDADRSSKARLSDLLAAARSSPSLLPVVRHVVRLLWLSKTKEKGKQSSAPPHNRSPAAVIHRCSPWEARSCRRICWIWEEWVRRP
ncbi:hypothetical protein ACLOJK_027942 [Asimina triloba]